MLTRSLYKANLIRPEASVVLISSIGSKIASLGNIMYMSSKGGLNSLMKGLALELAPKGIRVNSIEPGMIKTNLTNLIPDANLIKDMERLLEEAELDEAQEVRLEREFAREYHLITRADRLEKIAEDIVLHFMGRGFQGKAMVVSVDKATAVRMFNQVHTYWNYHLAILKAELETCSELGSERCREGLSRL